MSDMLTNWHRLTGQTLAAIRPGMEAGADLIEVQAQQGAHDVIIGMSGATFASIVAYVADNDNDGTSEIVAAYNAAAGRLQNFTGHQGQPYLADVPGPKANETWIVLTVPTDYIDRILMERDDFLGDAGYSAAPAAFQALLSALKGAWRL